MKKKSIWENEKKNYEINKMPDVVNTDILIIGGGISGITLAYLLRDSEKKVTLIDKSIIGMGVTSKTTAKISYIQQDIYQKLNNDFGLRIAKEYYNSQKEATKIICEIIRENNIKCDLKKVTSTIFTLEEKGIQKINKERIILESFGVKVKNVTNKNIKSGIKVFDTFTFHPLKYLDAIRNVIKDKIDIYENIIAKDIINRNGKYYIKTSRGIITAKIVVMMCHYPFFLIPTFIPFKTHIKREYVNAAKVKNIKDYTAISIDKDLHSIRFYNNYLIYGSNEHLLTNKIDYKKNYDKSINDFYKYFYVKPEYTWMNQDVVSNDNLPFIGLVKENLYISTAYNAWGITNGTIGAKIICDLIKYNKSNYKNIFNPKRQNTKLYFNSFFNSFLYLKALFVSLFKKNPYYIKKEGIMYGIYVDKDGRKHTIKLLCPHMKCHLVFNAEEITWDCPCHGSRFDIDGKLIEGPATKSIKKGK